MLTYLEVFARYAGYLTGISAAIVILIKPLRELVFGQKAEREALKCLLRQDMLSTYYKCKDEDKIRQYEAENFVMEYKAYKGLHGNSFIDEIAAAERKWEIIT